MTELCERHGVTRPTGYKWVARYRAGGDDALSDRSRAPHHSPHRTAAELETLVLAARQQYGWGARKLLQLLRTKHPTRAWPAPSQTLRPAAETARTRPWWGLGGAVVWGLGQRRFARP